MAEYYLSYGDIYKLIDDCICEEQVYCNEHKAEILTAITCNMNRSEKKDINEIVSLWDNLVLQPSDLLLGTRYIRISDIALCFIEIALNSGFIDYIIQLKTGQAPPLQVSISASIVLSIHSLLSSVCKLNDWDFCVYLQAVKNFHRHKEFSKETLVEWLPEFGTECNIENNSKWCCSYKTENNICNFACSESIDKALNSLCLKGILQAKNEDGQYVFKFEY